MTTALIAYCTQDGQTLRIAERIAATLVSEGVGADVCEAAEAPVDLNPYDVIALGGPIHRGRHDPDLQAFAHRLGQLAGGGATAFFSVSLTASRTDERSREAVQTIVDDTLVKAGWQPQLVTTFGGALPYTHYGVIKRLLMRWVVKREGGPTDISQDYEFTDWGAVDEFARALARLVHPPVLSKEP